jgi:glycosyltransferase involved in cell wall biosynthesis
MNGIDFDSWTEAHKRRVAANPTGWPARFVFVGRYIDIKGVDVLVDAYRMYRTSRQDAWPLTCCGRGPREGLLAGIDGLTNRGFVQPHELAGVFAEHGVLVLPSRYDPWPLTVVEGAAAGLPVICSEACGSAVEVIRSFFNGMTVTTGDAATLARAMGWMHDHHELLPEFGRRGSVLASAYAAQRWADRWESCIEELRT